MKLELINKVKGEYLHCLLEGQCKPDILFRHCVKKWDMHFDIDEMHLSPILDRAMKNNISGRLWGGEHHSIKSGLLLLSKQNPDLFWTAIKDLFNEDRMLIMKVNRFIHHCDEIFIEIKKNDKKQNTHFQNYESACLLLSFYNPINYCLFKYKSFSNFCKKIGVQDVPIETDLERYYKIIKVIYKIISKDEYFMNTYYSLLEGDIYLGPSLNLMNDLIDFCGQEMTS